ncbi:hypothetical protein CYMTET_27361 [Cymbomonas tetramitiformis]|uniref:Uncharacterized protein n=1 Tax=Cymbomonas tetramitiformis TaxID=36881 RepID=A0AAE0KWZ8_9CHLO|nr:hypothetical protein CYMTET_27361 [Cymbomonas tetramitiformis]
MAAPPPNPAMAAARAAYTAPHVLPAANAAATFWDSIVTGRMGRAKMLDATSQLFLRLQPVGTAVSVYILPPEIPHLARLQQVMILTPDAATPSDIKIPFHWDIGVATTVWLDVKKVSIQRWKDVRHFVMSLQAFAVARVPIAAGPGMAVGPLLPIAAGAPDPAIVLLQQQLAKQQADHTAALITTQAESRAAVLAAVPGLLLRPVVRGLLDTR